jgi:hypothetical protein
MSVTAAQLAHESEFPIIKDHSDLCFIAFALNDCTVKTDPQAAKYLRAVHRTALELAVPNYFGASVGGFWLTEEHIARLRALAEHYPANEALDAARAVDAYLQAQLQDCYLECGGRAYPVNRKL